MTGIYLTDLASRLRAGGLTVVEYQGWQTRARSSGGYSAMPLCVMWHHTASQTSPANDASFMCNGSSDRPIANILVARTGETWVLAAGATNTNGKGNALTFSRGTVPADSMNTRALGVEIANSGVGESFPAAQIEAMFEISNICNAWFGNQPNDLSSHNRYAPTRKIDPATAAAVQGPWRPRSVNSSGTWSDEDIRNECLRRAAVGPSPGPEPGPIPDEEDEDMKHLLGTGSDGSRWAINPDDWTKFALWTEDVDALVTSGQFVESNLRGDTVDRMPGVGVAIDVRNVGG